MGLAVAASGRTEAADSLGRVGPVGIGLVVASADSPVGGSRAADIERVRPEELRRRAGRRAEEAAGRIAG